jgi:hypothetical protein
MKLATRLVKRFTALCLFGLLGTVGCGGAALYPVSGKVVFKDGKPLTGGWVVFEPLEPHLKSSATGDIQADGTFRLGTEGRADGAMAGWYRVLISPPRTNTLDENAFERPVIHPKYRDRDESPLKVEVKPDKSANHITLEVEAP